MRYAIPWTVGISLVLGGCSKFRHFPGIAMGGNYPHFMGNAEVF